MRITTNEARGQQGDSAGKGACLLSTLTKGNWGTDRGHQGESASTI